MIKFTLQLIIAIVVLVGSGFILFILSNEYLHRLGIVVWIVSGPVLMLVFNAKEVLDDKE